MKVTKQYIKNLVKEEINKTIEEAGKIPAPPITRPDPTVRPAAAPPLPMPPPGQEKGVIYLVLKGNKVFGAFTSKDQAELYASKVKAVVVPTKLV